MLGGACGLVCLNVQLIVSQWEVFAQYPTLLCVFILTVGFTGINYMADCIVIFLVFMASLQTIVFWIKQAWYFAKHVMIPYKLLTPKTYIYSPNSHLNSVWREQVENPMVKLERTPLLEFTSTAPSAYSTTCTTSLLARYLYQSLN